MNQNIILKEKLDIFSDKKVEKIRQERDDFKNKFIRCEAAI